MRYDPACHHRRSVRLRGYDYAQAGAYFITVCTYQRRCLLGAVFGERVKPSRFGKLVRAEWLRSCEIRPELTLDPWVIMPNHLHGIVIIGADSHLPLPLGLRWCDAVTHTGVGTHGRAPLRRQARSLASFVAGFKAASTRRINALRDTRGAAVWQRGFYEHVIRDTDDLEQIRCYVAENPRRWADDRENPAFSPGARMLRARGDTRR